MGRGSQKTATLDKPTTRRRNGAAPAAAAPNSPSGVFTPIIDPSTPPFYQEILETEDESTLLARLPKSHTYGEYVVILHRLSQLREQHAVTGLLSSAVYAKAKAEADVVKVRLDEAQAELEVLQQQLAAYLAEIEKSLDDDHIAGQVETERAQLESELLGYEWRRRLALEAFEQHPEVVALRAEIEKATRRASHGNVSNEKKLQELTKKLRKSIIAKGPTHPDTVALLAEKEKLSSADSGDEQTVPAEVADIEKQLDKLRLRLLGKEKEDKKTGERSFSGGEIDLSDAFARAKEEVELPLEVRLLERQAEIRRSNLQGGEAADKVNAAKDKVAKIQAEYDEVAAKVHVHEAALERAKRRAERARQKVVRFEPQQTGKDLEQELQKRPRQARALFVTDSELKDNILYVAALKGNAFEAFAEIRAADDSQFVAKMKKAGATVEANAAISTKNSYHNLAAGNRYTIKLPGKGAIHYVPHTPLKGASPIMSERGMLRVEGLAPDQAAKALQDFGLHSGLANEVPYDLIYRGTHRFGRVLPHHEPLASGREALKMPDGHMVVHGITGAGGGDAVIKRLEQIVESGGLKSIAERRRMSIEVSSTCPESDTMEGIDMGVPTQIRKDTSYGSHMWLLMHPEVINRRDCFFVPSGSGYEAYAKSIGQGTIHDPAPVAGRQKHLDSGLGGGNEWYFHHEISWNEVDTILVADEIYNQVVSKVSGWKQQGLLPDNVRVTSVSAGLVEPETKAKKGGWQVDEATGEVFYEEEDLTPVQTSGARNGAAMVIQRRARELARSLD